MTEREKLLAGLPYQSGDPEIVADLERAARVNAAYNATSIDEPVRRRALLEELVGAAGEDVFLRRPCGSTSASGRRSARARSRTSTSSCSTWRRVTIGEDVQIGPNVQLLTPTHPVDPVERRTRIEGAEPIVIGDNVWLGGGVIVLPGVTIGENTVVGAGSVVVRDLPANVVAVGNPARVVREL